MIDHPSVFTAVSAGESLQISGGGFAYDVGRCVRFAGIFLFGGQTGPTVAVADWYCTTLLNE